MYKKLTEEEKKKLEYLPKYDDAHPETWVGSRDYYEAVFETETNRDPELHKDFSKLHKDIVDMVIRFCKDHNLTDVDEFCVSADGLRGSIPHGEWCSCTDSSMSVVKMIENPDPASKKHFPELPDREHPFLFEI